jgi:hypothetical protein
VLGAGSLVKEEFGQGIDLVMRIKQDAAHGLGQARASGLARVHTGESLAAQAAQQEARLGGLAGFVRTFQDDEPTAASRHGADSLLAASAGVMSRDDHWTLIISIPGTEPPGRSARISRYDCIFIKT